ncbi:S8 family peptidase [Aquabacterium sp.]|uniref:S8 family peptidase n=1 Tax=Aquabacterium sp. TaxID=1872578 RepID=UPI002C66F9E2|nr:S8 family serine peptidase [Aquabacterium sp.]HSW07863.1 S8 family serine peptidase [Aquabacterium sp.]
MNTRAWIFTRLLLAAGLLPVAGAVTAAERGPQQLRRPAVQAEDASTARVIVKYKADSSLMRALSASGTTSTTATTATATALPQHAARLAQRLALPLTDGRVLGRRTQALRGTGLSSSQLATRLAALPDVEWAVVDQRRQLYALPNDPYLGDRQTGITPTAGQWYLRAPDATLASAINAVGAWDVSVGSAAVTIAVLDTGVRLDHPDLAGKLHPGYDFIADRTTANDGGGRDSDASDPGDWTTANECSAGEAAYSSSWHGTQVAGLIGAATNNGIGIAGVGRNVMLLPVRVLGRCGGYDSDIIAGMRWAAGLSETQANPHPARVLNMSLGSSGACEQSYAEVFNELSAAGVSVVVASGNDTGLAIGVPANCAGAIAVAGVRHLGSKVGYSNVGPEMSIAAPAGNCVNDTGACLYPLLTTTNSGSTSPGANIYSDSYTISVGTSFATPLVAGTVGLMLSIDPTLTPAQVKAALRASARPFPSSGAASGVVACHAPNGVEQIECYCTTSTCGAGMLDAAAAVVRVQAGAVPAPTVTISASTSAPAAGTSVTLDGSTSVAQGGRTIAAYQWAITAGSTLASFSGATDAVTATLATSAAGSVTVSLTVTDSAGVSSTGSSTLTVGAVPTVTVGATTSSGGGGGGAMGAEWLLALALAVFALRRSARAD